jgi:hypothetical protein
MRAGIYSRFGPSATLGEQFIEHVNALQWAIHMLPPAPLPPQLCRTRGGLQGREVSPKVVRDLRFDPEEIGKQAVGRLHETAAMLSIPRPFIYSMAAPRPIAAASWGWLPGGSNVIARRLEAQRCQSESAGPTGITR